MADTAASRAKLDALALELHLSKKQRSYADALAEDPTTKGGGRMRTNHKIRRYVDEAIVVNRELARASGLPQPTPGTTTGRMELRASGAIWGFVSFPEPTRDPRTGEAKVAGGGILDVRGALKAGLGACIVSMHGETVDIADSMAADAILGRWLGLEKISVVRDDDDDEASRRRAYALWMANNPDKAKVLEGMSIEMDRIRITMTATAKEGA